MATHTISNNRKTFWDINETGDTWILKASGSIEVWDLAAINEDNSYSNNVIKVFGDVTGLGSGDGIWLEGDGTRTTIGKDATVIGLNAFRSDGNGQRITNSGELFGTGCSLFSTGDDLVFTNKGTMFATMSADINGDNTTFINGAKGKIYGEYGIVSMSDTRLEIINKGMLSANVAVMVDDVFDSERSAHVVNTGRIYGEVILGDGDDIFDNRGGFFDGTVTGNDGDDVYLISDSDTNLHESASEGIDTVKSSASFALFDHFENLTLLGRADIDGDGNDGSNILTGNKGRNILTGFDGIDILNGKAGNDTLDGGDDDTLDLYVFNRGTGRDVISLFEDGDDLISLASYDGIEDFGDISVTQAGADTLVTLLDNDRVRVKNFTAANLTDDDFAFEIF